MKIDLKNKQAIGWIQGFISVFGFIGIVQVFSRYSTIMWQVNPVIFSCCAFSACAFILILRGGPGQLVKETIRSIDTWIYGFVLMISYIIGMLMYEYVTSTELTMIQKISVSLTLMFSWLFMARTPDKYQLLGTLIITTGVFLVAYDINHEHKAIAYFLAFFYGFVQAARVFLAELHRPHVKASSLSNDPKAKARVIGFVMLVVSLLFLWASLMISWLQYIDGDIILIRGVPTFDDFKHAPTIITGMLAGILLMAPLRVLEFSSSQIIKAENFMTILTFMTVSTLFWEWVTSPITGLDLKAITGIDLIAVVLITGGGLIISLTRGLKKKNNIEEFVKYAPQNISDVDDSKRLINVSMQYFNQDIKKVSKTLKLPIEVISAIRFDEQNVIALKADVFKRASNRYAKNIAIKDSLTGVLNKTGFVMELREYFARGYNFDLLFIDLNKFKPVNDDYGHDAGDFVLEQVGKRLKDLMQGKGLVGRLGGDEFVVLVNPPTQAGKIVEQIKETINEDFIFNDNHIKIGASIGVANNTEAETPEALIKLADDKMYEDKGSRER